MKETRKQKIARQQGYRADRAFKPIHDAIERGDLVIGPPQDRDEELVPRLESETDGARE